MNEKIEEERTCILRALDSEDTCISISAIALYTGLNRHAVARHMDSLEMLGKVRKLDVGRAKKYLLVKKIPEYGLIDISTDFILIVNPQLSVQYLNEAAARHFKTSLQDCIGKDIRALKFPLLLHRDFIRTLNSFTYEKSEKVTLQDNNGSWFEITLLGFSLLAAPNQIAII
ncbi:MAG TPA: PAS domain-containing protein, partial [Methanospirillum sp.]|uniref:PAS domain-containing protein n=1 Tax=Methanospirillum sp. TaxID=45200 RepID=UPI002B5A4368